MLERCATDAGEAIFSVSGVRRSTRGKGEFSLRRAEGGGTDLCTGVAKGGKKSYITPV
jgi:hypothetical protein